MVYLVMFFIFLRWLNVLVKTMMTLDWSDISLKENNVISKARKFTIESPGLFTFSIFRHVEACNCGGCWVGTHWIQVERINSPQQWSWRGFRLREDHAVIPESQSCQEALCSRSPTWSCFQGSVVRPHQFDLLSGQQPGFSLSCPHALKLWCLLWLVTMLVVFSGAVSPTHIQSTSFHLSLDASTKSGSNIQ